MENLILITQLNDFIFCPKSIYFHNLHGDMETVLFQSEYQLKGTSSHEAIDKSTYSTKKSVLTSLDVYCEKYGLIGKIDMFDSENKILRERKRQIKNIYDGYVFQLYGQYFSLKELGYDVKKLELYSMVDNKIYKIKRPEDDKVMLEKFENLIYEMKTLDISNYKQENKQKCKMCIYSSACDNGINEEDIC